MKIKASLLRRAVVIFIGVLAISLAGGAWYASAQGTIPGGGDTGPAACGTAVQPRTSASDAHLYTGVGPNGANPCGVFEICGHGPKAAHVGDYPQCQGPNLTVFCLTEKGVWTAQEVFDVGVSPNGAVVTFYSGQHGTCALFPANTTAAQLNSGVISGGE